MRKLLILLLLIQICIPQTLYTEEETANIPKKISARLKADPNFGAHELQIKESRDSLILEGWVANIKDMTLLSQIAEESAGALKVVNHVELRSTQPSPSSLAQTVYQAISQDTSLRGYSLNVEASGAIVTLRGNVNQQSTIPLLVNKARKVPGVKEVISQLVQRAMPSDTEMQQAAKEALKAAGFLGIRAHLDVTVEDGVAFLRGDAQTPEQIDHAMSVLVSVYGVRDVRNYAALPNYPAQNFHVGIPMQQGR